MGKSNKAPANPAAQLLQGKAVGRTVGCTQGLVHAEAAGGGRRPCIRYGPVPGGRKGFDPVACACTALSPWLAPVTPEAETLQQRGERRSGQESLACFEQAVVSKAGTGYRAGGQAC